MPKQLNEFASDQPGLDQNVGAEPANAMPEGDSDHEGAMAKADLYKLSNYSLKLFKQINDSDQLEAWVQAKITKAADYIASVYHYLEYEMKFSEYGSKLENSDVYSESEKKELLNKLQEAKQMLRTLKIQQVERLDEGKKAKKDYDGDGKVESGKDEYLGSKIKAAKKAGKLDETMGGEMCACEACGGTGQVQAPVKSWGPEAKAKAATYNRKAKAYAAAAKRIDKNKNGIPDDEEGLAEEPKSKKKPVSKKEAPAEESAGSSKHSYGQGVYEGKKKSSKPDFLDMDKDGNKKEPMKKAVKEKKKKISEGPLDAISDFAGDMFNTDASLERRSPQLQQLLAMRKKYPNGTPEAKQIDARINLLKDRLKLDGGEVMGQGGMPKEVLPPDEFTKQNPNFKYEGSMNESAELNRMKEFLTRLNG